MYEKDTDWSKCSVTGNIYKLPFPEAEGLSPTKVSVQALQKNDA